ncbi:MAG TPA: SAM-dependent methyltransferase [Xanthomonadaceae bacterium]|jgi:methyltransferase (TIGR00027 family)|nr:SAM-dependent methyltransferase [Xanthomonadaceae bacterium]
MTDPTSIRNVSDTALWVAVYRAMESERPDALFHDPYARRLAGERGAAIAKKMRGARWSLVVRTAVMDEILLRCLQQGVKTVLNLAAGLDARPYRLPLDPTLRWIHVDLPDMVEYFRSQMAGEKPRCELTFVEADLRDGEQRKKVFADAAAHGPVLAITEGLLIYLESDAVAGLARELHDIAKARWWLTDLASPLLLKFNSRRGQSMLRNAPFRFAPAEGTAFFTPFGWHEAEFRSTWDDSFRLHRTMRWAWLWRLLLRLRSQRTQQAIRRIYATALLESG